MNATATRDEYYAAVRKCCEEIDHREEWLEINRQLEEGEICEELWCDRIEQTFKRTRTSLKQCEEVFDSYMSEYDDFWLKQKQILKQEFEDRLMFRTVGLASVVAVLALLVKSGMPEDITHLIFQVIGFVFFLALFLVVGIVAWVISLPGGVTDYTRRSIAAILSIIMVWLAL